ncbi:MAG: DEAD/DEAH box helicase [Pyrinomonadaceae bacterium]|nr:DEAD/DEAH box helicase [Pyrinomonadaceae bacterium]
MNRLPHTFDALLSRFGRFTEIQAKAIDPLLAGKNCVLISATASGKTEAALAPILERQFQKRERTNNRRPSAVSTLFVVPTRALTRDLARRLAQPLEKLALNLTIKTGDEPALKQNKRTDILLTTPESFDSLLANRPKMLKDIRAVILDELHLYTDTARGDQLRILLNRLRRLRNFAHQQGDAADADVQFCALSATMDDPLQVASNYFAAPFVVESQGQRAIDAELVEYESPNDLQNLFAQLKNRGLKKVLVFGNSRAEAEAMAHQFRNNTPFGDKVFVHHANLAARIRHAAEEKFTKFDAALCFATATLELGIDIGDVDLIVLISPPDNTASFLQRIGRGNRRTQRTNVVCFYRGMREHALFRVFLKQAQSGEKFQSTPAAPFRPSVVVQQLFSYIKQTRHGEIEPALAYELFHSPNGEPLLPKNHYDQIIENLLKEDYFASSRGTALKPSAKWQELFEQRVIYTNFGDENSAVEIVDELTGRKLGYLERGLPVSSTFLLGGQKQVAKRRTGKKLFVSPTTETAIIKPHGYFAPRPLSFELARALAVELGVPVEDNKLPLVLIPDSSEQTDDENISRPSILFHCAGLAYGLVLGDLLESVHGLQIDDCDEFSLTLSDVPPEISLSFPASAVSNCVQKRWRQFESWFAPGRWQKLLPPNIRAAHVGKAFNLEKFTRSFEQARFYHNGLSTNAKISS